jgi:hypothetical protein
MSMAQVGTQQTLNLSETGTLALQGAPLEDQLHKVETVAFGTGRLLDESPSRTETLVQGVGQLLSESPTIAETVVITNV